MFLDFANNIIDDHNRSPYCRSPASPVDYYASVADIRPISDTTIIAGLLYYYATQQVSKDKIMIYRDAYFCTLNSDLWHIISGSGPIRARPVDGGSNKRHSPPTSEITGLPE